MAKLGITVKVTEEDINQGTPMSLHRCALVIALNRQTNSKWVTDGCSIFNIKDHMAYNLPFECRDFVRRFDAKEKMNPAAFSL